MHKSVIKWFNVHEPKLDVLTIIYVFRYNTKELVKSTSPEKQLEASIQKKFSLDLPVKQKKFDESMSRPELKLNLTLCPTFLDDVKSTYFQSKSAYAANSAASSTGSHETSEKNSSSSITRKKLKKKKRKKTALNSTREYIPKTTDAISNLTLFKADQIGEMLNTLSMLGSIDSSLSVSTLSPPYKRNSEYKNSTFKK